MATKKSRGITAAPEGNRHGRNSPKQPNDADDALQRPYKDYDENRKSSDPKHETDFGADGDDARKRNDHQRDSNKETRRQQ